MTGIQALYFEWGDLMKELIGYGERKQSALMRKICPGLLRGCTTAQCLQPYSLET